MEESLTQSPCCRVRIVTTTDLQVADFLGQLLDEVVGPDVVGDLAAGFTHLQRRHAQCSRRTREKRRMGSTAAAPLSPLALTRFAVRRLKPSLHPQGRLAADSCPLAALRQKKNLNLDQIMMALGDCSKLWFQTGCSVLTFQHFQEVLCHIPTDCLEVRELKEVWGF